jgi:hypothetical protein
MHISTWRQAARKAAQNTAHLRRKMRRSMRPRVIALTRTNHRKYRWKQALRERMRIRANTRKMAGWALQDSNL